MLDLEKSYGIYEGVAFFGDHEDDKIVYYFPDEVIALDKEDGDLEFYFQMFYHDNIMTYDVASDECRVGSVLQLGVGCVMPESRLIKALDSLIRKNGLHKDTNAIMPIWIDGSIDLICLDYDYSSSKTPGKRDSLVTSVLGSNKPNLGSSKLEGIFNVLFDKNGTEIIFSSLNSGGSSFIGVLYNLKYNCLSPSVRMRISADLNACQRTASEVIKLGVTFKYKVGVDLSFELEDVFKQMVEKGDVKIDVFSLVESDEEKKRVDEVVRDFKHKIIKELFNISIDKKKETCEGDMENLISKVLNSDNLTFLDLSLRISLKNEEISVGKKLEVDYSQRTSIVRTFCPNGNLWNIGEKMRCNPKKYVSKTPLGNLFRRRTVKFKLDYDFSVDKNLVSVEVFVWDRKKGGASIFLKNKKVANSKSDGFITSFILSEAFGLEKNISWSCEEFIDASYYYQVVFLFSNTSENSLGAFEIKTDPMLSFSDSILLSLDTYLYYKEIKVKVLDSVFDEFSHVDVSVDVYNKTSLIETTNLSLDYLNKETKILIHYKKNPYIDIYISKRYYYKDKKYPIEINSVKLIGQDIIVREPFFYKEIPVFFSGWDLKDELFLVYEVRSKNSRDNISKLIKLSLLDSCVLINVKLLSLDDIVSFCIYKVFGDGLKTRTQQLREVVYEVSKISKLEVDLSESLDDEYLIIWKGNSPKCEDLKYLKVIIKNNRDEVVHQVKFSGNKRPKDYKFSCDEEETSLCIEVERKYMNGEKAVIGGLLFSNRVFYVVP